jgi:hypothetical protein
MAIMPGPGFDSPQLHKKRVRVRARAITLTLFLAPALSLTLVLLNEIAKKTMRSMVFAFYLQN